MSLQQGGTLVGRSWSDSLDCSRFPSEEDKFTIVGDESFQRSRVVMMVFILVVRRVFYIGSRWIVEIVFVFIALVCNDMLGSVNCSDASGGL